MKYSTIVFCLFSIESVFGYNFYSLPKFKRIHSNEPNLFKNKRSEENLIRLSKEYDINIEGNNFVKLKKDLYKRYMKNRNIYYVDLDNTICSTKGNDYTNSVPYYYKIQELNKLYNLGHEIHYWTDRGHDTGMDWGNLTLKQMRLWNVKYSTLNSGKPYFDLMIDDKCVNIKDYFIPVSKNEEYDEF